MVFFDDTVHTLIVQMDLHGAINDKNLCSSYHSCDLTNIKQPRHFIVMEKRESDE